MRMRDFTCGACGLVFGTNFAEDQVECAECEARRCPECLLWFGSEEGYEQGRAPDEDGPLERAEAAEAALEVSVVVVERVAKETAAEMERAERAEALLAEILQAVTTFTSVRVCGADTLDLAEAVRQIAERNAIGHARD